MGSMYDEINHFMQEYFPAYNQYAQTADTQHIMDKFYAPGLSFDDSMVSSREQWYKRCLAHPAVQDKLAVDQLFIDEKKNEVVALLKTQAIDKATGEMLLELSMCALYNLVIDQNQDIKMTKVKIFLETNPGKVAKLSQLYVIK